MNWRSNFLLTLGLGGFALAAGFLLGERQQSSPAQIAEQPGGPRDGLGLMTSLPIYWPEADGPAELLQSENELHWARQELERHYRLEPLDTLATGNGLEALGLLLLAQPRALSPQENVALDEWVLAGGRLLLFADPLLTGESRFHIGDRRRPQDVILLSPILARWGLELVFDEEQPGELRSVELANGEVPIRLAGTLRLVAGTGSKQARCEILAQGHAAQCAYGKGRVVILADAALLDGSLEGTGAVALALLTQRAFHD